MQQSMAFPPRAEKTSPIRFFLLCALERRPAGTGGSQRREEKLSLRGALTPAALFSTALQHHG